MPIAAWSRSLIPDEKIDIDDATLKDVLRSQIDVSAPAMLAATLAFHCISADEAKRQAAASMSEIRPAAHFVIDKASLHAVRPLLLLDVAGLSDSAPGPSARGVAVGAGIGVTVITARLEAGYMRTVS
ncbi:MAG: hypothetical protein ABIN96_06045, partial [Rubrivivax sp.]